MTPDPDPAPSGPPLGQRRAPPRRASARRPRPDARRPRAARVLAAAPRLRVEICDAKGRPAAAAAPGLGRWLQQAAPALARGAVTLALVGDARMRALNREYRGKDYATDVLSFPADAPDPDGPGAPGQGLNIAAGAAAGGALDQGREDRREAGRRQGARADTGSGPGRHEGHARGRAARGNEMAASRQQRGVPPASVHGHAAARAAVAHLGDVVIAKGVAARQAREAGHSIATELRVLALHGLLHLLGYDHERDRGEMGRVERRLRRRAGLREGLIERAV
jgi:ssRNA-specific RNase YbeY (16S rRNA maturation enzyme)